MWQYLRAHLWKPFVRFLSWTGRLANESHDYLTKTRHNWRIGRNESETENLWRNIKKKKGGRKYEGKGERKKGRKKETKKERTEKGSKEERKKDFNLIQLASHPVLSLINVLSITANTTLHFFPEKARKYYSKKEVEHVSWSLVLLDKVSARFNMLVMFIMARILQEKEQQTISPSNVWP